MYNALQWFSLLKLEKIHMFSKHPMAKYKNVECFKSFKTRTKKQITICATNALFRFKIHRKGERYQ